MFIKQTARKLKCHTTTLGNLIRSKKIQAELKVAKSGRKSYFITTPLEEIEPLLTKHGWKQKKSSKSSSNLLNELITWRAIPLVKRNLLIELSKATVPELKLLRDLIK